MQSIFLPVWTRRQTVAAGQKKDNWTQYSFAYQRRKRHRERRRSQAIAPHLTHGSTTAKRASRRSSRLQRHGRNATNSGITAVFARGAVVGLAVHDATDRQLAATSPTVRHVAPTGSQRIHTNRPRRRECTLSVSCAVRHTIAHDSGARKKHRLFCRTVLKREKRTQRSKNNARGT